MIGPTQFFIFVNDLLHEVQSSGKMFGDDATLYRRIKEPDHRTILQKDLDKLHEWSNRWLLQFNEDKCKVMHIGRTNTAHQYHLGSTHLTQTYQEKHLGVLATPHLKLTAQVAKAAPSANSVLGRINNTFTCLQKEVLLPLYTSMLRAWL